jgi:hypothetical protein
MYDRISVAQIAHIRISTAAGRMQVSQPVAVAHISGIGAERLCGNGTEPFCRLGFRQRSKLCSFKIGRLSPMPTASHHPEIEYRFVRGEAIY